MDCKKFGTFKTVEDLNRAAAVQLAEGDIEAVLALAEENGIDKEDALDYINGAASELATPRMAALGKLDMEVRELKPKLIMEDWVAYIRACTEEEHFCHMMFRSEKTLKGCISQLMKWSFINMIPVDKDIAKAVGVNVEVKMGIPGMRQAKQIIREYYTENKVTL